jgi:hypothetical protein
MSNTTISVRRRDDHRRSSSISSRKTCAGDRFARSCSVRPPARRPTFSIAAARSRLPAAPRRGLQFVLRCLQQHDFLRSQQGVVYRASRANRTDLAEFDVDTFGYTQSFVRDLDVYSKFTYGFDYYYDDVDAFRNRLNPQTGVITATILSFPTIARTIVSAVSSIGSLADRAALPRRARHENANADGTINAVSGTRIPFARTYQDWVGSVGLTYELTPVVHLVGSVSEGTARESRRPDGGQSRAAERSGLAEPQRRSGALLHL